MNTPKTRFLLHPLVPVAVWMSICSFTNGQQAVEVSLVVPFATSGRVTSGDPAPPPPEPGIPAPAGSNAAATKTKAPPPVVPIDGVNLAGSRINTGSDGATSLVLGAAGAARMTADSSVRVPPAGDKRHSLEMLKGQLFLNISADDLKKRGSGEFKLKTPAALLAVKGTKFFTVSKDGTDTIGVHEGRVSVTEPVSGSSLLIEAGSAVTVSAGRLGEVRGINANEFQLAAQYQLANLKRVPLVTGSVSSRYVGTEWERELKKFRRGTITSEVFKVQRMEITDLDRGAEPSIVIEEKVPKNNRSTTRCVLTPEGYVRLSWRPRVGTVDPQSVDLSLHNTGYGEARLEAANSPSRLVGIRFRYRAVNVASARGIDRAVIASISDRSDPSWHEMVIPVQNLRHSNGRGGQTFYQPSMQFSIQWIPTKHEDVSRPTPPASVVEMTDFEILATD